MSQAQEIGIQLYSVRNEVKKDLKGTLKQVREMGIKELEGGDLYGMDIDTYKKMLDGMGFQMVSIGVDYNDLNGDLSKTIEQAKKLFMTCFVISAVSEFTNIFSVLISFNNSLIFSN